MRGALRAMAILVLLSPLAPAASDPEGFLLLEAPSFGGRPLALAARWDSGVASPVAPREVEPFDAPDGVALPLPVLGREAIYAIVARSGDVERVVMGDPIFPRSVSLSRSAPAPASALPWLADGDLVVSATGFGGLGLFEPAFTLNFKRLASETFPLELAIVRMVDGGIAYVAFRTEAAPSSLALTARGTWETGLSLQLAAKGEASALTLLAGRTGTAPFGLEATFASPPALATIEVASAKGAFEASWTLAEETGLAIRESDSDGRLELQWARAPRSGELSISTADEGVGLAYEAETGGGPLFVSAALGARTLALHASAVPESWRLQVQDAGSLAVAYESASALDHLSFALATEGRGIVASASAVPRGFAASASERGALAFDAPEGFGRLRLYAGDLQLCLRADRAFVALARESDATCASFDLAGLRALDVKPADGALEFQAELSQPIPVAARVTGDLDGELAFSPLPRALSGLISLANGDVVLDASADTAFGLEGWLSTRGESPADLAPPQTGIVSRIGTGTASAFRLPAMPRALHVELTGATEGERDPTPALVGLSLGALGSAFDARLDLSGEANAPRVRLTWATQGTAGPFHAKLARHEGGWLDLKAAALPDSGSLRFEAGAMSFELSSPVALSVRASSARVPPPLPAPLPERGVVVSTEGEASAVAVELPRAPDEMKATWGEGEMTVSYRGLDGPGPFAIRSVDEERAVNGAFLAPRDAALALRSDAEGVSIHFEGSDAPSPARILVDGARGPGEIRIEEASRAFDLTVTNEPRVEYRAESAGATVSIGGEGDEFKLGRGGRLELSSLPREASLAPAGDGYALEASGPLTARIDLGEKRWGDYVLGFTTKKTVVALENVTNATVTPGLFGTDFTGEGGRLVVEHEPTDPGNAVLLVATASEGSSASWNRAEVPLEEGKTTTLWHSTNPLLLFHVSPIVAFGVTGALIGLGIRAIDRRWGKASSPPAP